MSSTATATDTVIKRASRPNSRTVRFTDAESLPSEDSKDPITSTPGTGTGTATHFPSSIPPPTPSDHAGKIDSTDSTWPEEEATSTPSFLDKWCPSRETFLTGAALTAGTALALYGGYGLYSAYHPSTTPTTAATAEAPCSLLTDLGARSLATLKTVGRGAKDFFNSRSALGPGQQSAKHGSSLRGVASMGSFLPFPWLRGEADGVGVGSAPPLQKGEILTAAVTESVASLGSGIRKAWDLGVGTVVSAMDRVGSIATAPPSPRAPGSTKRSHSVDQDDERCGDGIAGVEGWRWSELSEFLGDTTVAGSSPSLFRCP